MSNELPPGWEKKTSSKNGKVYFQSKALQKSVWKIEDAWAAAGIPRPQSNPPPPAAPAPAPPPRQPDHVGDVHGRPDPGRDRQHARPEPRYPDHRDYVRDERPSGRDAPGGSDYRRGGGGERGRFDATSDGRGRGGYAPRREDARSQDHRGGGGHGLVPKYWTDDGKGMGSTIQKVVAKASDPVERPIIPYKIKETGPSLDDLDLLEDALASMSFGAKRRDDRDDKNPNMIPLEGPDAGAASAVVRGDALEKYPLPPKWSKAGSSGQKTDIIVNYQKIVMNPDILDTKWSFYRIDFEPPSRVEENRRTMIDDLMREKKEMFPKAVGYDGDAIMISALPLPQDLFDLTTSLPARRGYDKDREFKVIFKKVAEVNMKALKAFYEGRLTEAPAAVLNAFNLVLLSTPARQNVRIKSNLFNDHNKQSLDNIADVWKGWHQSVRATDYGLLVNVDLMHGVFYKEQSIADFVQQLFRGGRTGLSSHDVSTLKQHLKSLQFEVRHSKKTRRHKIFGFSANPISQISFENRDGKLINVVDYYRDQYNVRLKYPNLPAVQSRGRDKKTIDFPMELCFITERQRHRKKLDPDQIASMIKQTTLKPDRRLDDTWKILDNLRFSEDAVVKSFGLSVPDELCKIKGRRLKAPSLKYASSTKMEPNGSWNLQRLQFHEAKPLDKWGCVNFDRGAERNIAQYFQDFAAQANRQGMKMNPRPHGPIINVPGRVTEEEMKKVFEDFLRDERGKECQIVFVVLCDKTAHTYQTIKYVMDAQLGILTQCFISKWVTQHKFSMPTAANIQLKLNVKLGGVNHLVETQRGASLLGDRVPTMVVGADVTHPMGGGDQDSLAAVVASMDNNAARYVAEVRNQDPRLEVIVQFDDIMRKHFASFRKAQGKFPEKVIIYRDGVSESQFNDILSVEIEKLSRVCEELQFRPKITVVVVQKRHHMRMYPDGRQQLDRSGNLPSGHIVDTTIVANHLRQFYLLSQAGLQGTSRPTCYTVIHDENDHSADEIQNLYRVVLLMDQACLRTYAMCWVYQRATKAVSVPAPIYYADLAAGRNRAYLSLMNSGVLERGYLSSAQGHDYNESQRRRIDAVDPKDLDGGMDMDDKRYAFESVHANIKDTMYYV